MLSCFKLYFPRPTRHGFHSEKPARQKTIYMANLLTSWRELEETSRSRELLESILNFERLPNGVGQRSGADAEGRGSATAPNFPFLAII